MALDAPPAVGFVDVTIVDFAAHTAYLEPFTGIGFLVLPPSDADLPPLDDSLVEVTWEFALTELDQLGWILLDDEDGQLESAGRTADDRVAICLYGDSSIIEEPSQTDIHRALTALRIAAGLPPEDG